MADTYDSLFDAEAKQQKKTTQSVDAYDAMFDAEVEQRTARLNASVNVATQVNPDKFAGVKNLATRTGLPVPVVERNEDTVAQQQRAREIQQAVAASPVLARQMSDPEFAKLAHDDVEQLGVMDQVLRFPWKATQGVASGLPSLAAGFYGTAAIPFELASQFVGKPLTGTILPEDIFGKVGEGLRGVAKGQQELAARVADVAPKAGLLERSIASGFQSLGQNLPPMAAAILTSNPELALGVMSAATGGQSYVKARDAGLSPFKATTFAATDAAIEYATERLPTLKLLGDLKAGTSLVKTFMRNQVGEQLGEQAATVLQDFNEWATLHPEQPFSKYLEERPSAALQTAIATVIGSGGQVAVMKAVQQVAEDRIETIRKVADVERNSAALDALNDALKNSKLLPRDPAAMASFLDQAAEDGEVKTLFINARTLAEAVGEENLNTLMQSSPDLAEKITAAAEAGGDVEMSLGTYGTTIVPMGVHEKVVDHVRVNDPNALSREEATTLLQSHAEEFAKRAEKTLEVGEFDSAWRDSQTTVENELLAQFNEANRFTPDVNKAYAKIQSAMHTTLAARLKMSGKPQYAEMTPELAYVTWPLQIRSENLPGGKPTMDQPGKQRIDTPEFKAWFGDWQDPKAFTSKAKGPVSQAVGTDGAPLRLYHATNADFSTFEAGRPTTNSTTLGDVETQRHAIFTSPDSKFAEGYVREGGGGNLMPVYMDIKSPMDLRSGVPGEVISDIVANSGGKITRNDFHNLPADQAWSLFDGTFGANFVAAAKAAGYDGAMLTESDPNTGDSVEVYAVFSPAQIKSATGNRGTYDPNDGNILHQAMSTRVPTAVGATENPLESHLSVGLEAAKNSGKLFDKLVDKVSGYVNFPKTKLRKSEAKAEGFVEHAVDNLLWLYDLVPAAIRERSKLWYVGASRIAHDWSDKYGLAPTQTAAALAVLSPQKDWFQNVSLAERILDALRDKGSFRWDQKMDETAARIYAKEDYAVDVADIKGKTLDELDSSYLKAMWIRTYDEAYNARAYRVVTPEGAFDDYARTASGAPKKVAWGSNAEIAKAISVIRDGSPANVSDRLGGNHKVRSFYNNIFDPHHAAGEATIDTHAVAAALLRPLVGGDIEVLDNFGAAGKSAHTGVRGTYALYAEAYRRAAAQRGVLPREMQSVTWEAVRGLFPDTFKTDANKAKVDAIWTKWKKGEVSIDELRNELTRAGGSVEKPEWLRSGTGENEPAWASSYSDQLREVGVRGEQSGGVAGGKQAGSAGRVRATLQQGGVDGSGQTGNGSGGYSSGSLAPLAGAPNVQGASGPDAALVAVAEQYARENGIDLKRQAEYVKVDPARAARIAAAYDAMPHAPNDPAVKEAYANLIKQTIAQYRALEAAGFKFYLFDETNDPYAGNPWNAMRDLRANKQMAVFATEAGFGSGATDLDTSGNPLMSDTGIVWPYGAPDGPMKRVLANDLFRAVHDAFGHGLEGAGFRAEGEENAWQAHVKLFTGSAIGAITSETRGQNSWLNYGPHGENNRTAKVEDTVFADQKTGLMPAWTWQEGIAPSQEAIPTYGESHADGVDVIGIHFSPGEQTHLLGSHYGTGLKGAERDSVMKSEDPRMRERTYFYVPEGQGVQAEKNVGAIAHAVELRGLYDVQADPLGIWRNDGESAVLDAGFSGYYSRGAYPKQGVAIVFGNEGIPVAQVGNEASANARFGKTNPAPVPINPAKQLAVDLINDKRLPSGALEPSKWRDMMEAVAPDLLQRLPAAVFAGTSPVYRDEMARMFYQPTRAQNNARGTITFGDDIKSKPTIITLLQNADLSTFLHESGHFYLEVLNDIASQPDAPQEIVEDMNKLLKWFSEGMTLQQWNAMSLEEKRPYHEQLARGFEAYLFEGKAPNAELTGLFSRMRAWMLNVYKSITSLNVTLTDEVRGVFDRMIATNEQIIEAERARNMVPQFTEKPEGVEDDEWQKYQELGLEAKQSAVDELQKRSLRDMKWLSNAKSGLLKKLQRDAADKRKAVEAEVTDEVRSMPVYAAMRFLSKGELPEADRSNAERKILDDLAGQPVKLSLPALKEMYGEGPAAPWRYLPVGKSGLAATEGVHPDMLAELFGFTSGDHLVRAILDAQQETVTIEGMTDQRMLERYGDINSPDALDRAVNEALHNEARARFAATEYKFASKVNTPVRVIMAAAKEFASKAIGGKKVKDVKPNQYTAAETRAARAAEKARGKDDTAFVSETRNKLLNNALAKEGNEALNEVEKGLRLFDRLSESKTIDLEYKEQIDALLDRFDFRKISNKEAARRQSLLEWAEAQKAKGLEPVVPAELLNEANRKPYREMTVEEFRGLVDTVKNIAHLGRLKHKLLTAKDAREFAERVAEAEAAIRENAKTTVPVELERNSWLVKMKELKNGYFAMHRKFASMIREMDGWKDGGVLWELFSRPMNEAGDRESVLREQATIKVSELMEPLLKAGKMGEKVFIPAINASLTREGRIAIALNTGNEGNLQRLMDGDKWSAPQVQAIIDTLTKEEMDFVQAVWDFIGSYRAEIAEQQRKLTGVEPTWVEPTPVKTQHGTYRGGYYPAKYDTKRSTRSLADEAAAGILDQWKAARGSAKTRDSFTKGRANQVINRPLRKDLGVLTQHVTEVTHRLAWQDFLVDANRLLRAGPIDNAIREHYGAEVLESMRKAIEDIAAGEVGAQNAFESALNYARMGATIAGLGWRLTTALLQPIGLTQSMVRVGPKYVAKGLAEWIGDTAKFESTVEKIYEKSDMMRLRGKTMQREINEIQNKVADRNSAIQSSYFYLIQKLQIVADVPTWLGQYHKAIENGANEDTAVAQADQAVLDAQGGGQIKDLAEIQRGGPMLKLFTNFYSFFNTTYNLTAESYGRTNFKNPLSIGRLAVDMLLLYSLPAALGTLLKAALHAGDDGEDEKKLIKQLIADQMSYLFGTMVGVRELAGGVSTALGLPGDYSGPASVRLFAEVAKLGKQAGQGEIDEALLKAINNVGGILLHYPAGQINATLDGIYTMMQGKTENPGALLVGSNKK